MSLNSADGKSVPNAGEAVPADWRLWSVAKSRPMEITIRNEFFYQLNAWQFKFPLDGVVVEEHGRNLYRAVPALAGRTSYYDWTVTEPDGAVVAHIRQDWRKREAGTKKLLGFIEYSAPRPEFAVTGPGGTEFARIGTITDAAKSNDYPIYRTTFAGQEYRLQEISGSRVSNNLRWAVFCGKTKVAESSKWSWIQVCLKRMDISIVGSEHLPSVVFLALTMLGDEKTKRDSGPQAP